MITMRTNDVEKEILQLKNALVRADAETIKTIVSKLAEAGVLVQFTADGIRWMTVESLII